MDRYRQILINIINSNRIGTRVLFAGRNGLEPVVSSKR